MSSFYVDLKSRTPIYEQLVENISRMVLRGVLAPDEGMPSVRQLAAELGINPNTIQKAYAELERQGIIYSLQGRGSFVSDDISAVTEKRCSEILQSMKKSMQECRDLGVSRAAVEALLDEVWK